MHHHFISNPQRLQRKMLHFPWCCLDRRQHLSAITIIDFKTQMDMNKKVLFAFYKGGWYCKTTLRWQTVIWVTLQEEPPPSFQQSWSWASGATDWLLQLAGRVTCSRSGWETGRAVQKQLPGCAHVPRSMPLVRGNVERSWYKPVWSDFSSQGASLGSSAGCSDLAFQQHQAQISVPDSSSHQKPAEYIWAALSSPYLYAKK